jgi:type I restriction enzyme, R subunit
MIHLQFQFLQPEFPDLYSHVAKAEELALSDPRGACFYARLGLENIIKWMYCCDAALKNPYETTLSALIHEPTFRNLVAQGLVTKAKIIKDIGNKAAHDARDPTTQDAKTVLSELFHFAYWFVRTYAKGEKPDPSISFQADKLQKNIQISIHTAKRIQALEQEFQETKKQKAQLEAETEAYQQEIQRIKAENAKTIDTHDYSEAQTRDTFIDLLLSEAGWKLNNPQDREYEVVGMPNNAGKGYVDYVLWGKDGKPLGLIEAKATKHDARKGQRQAELYANALEEKFGQRPIIFYTNGYEHWMWDDKRYPPRKIHGFLKHDELELMLQRRSTLKTLGSLDINKDIAGRYYQTRAIRRICETFEKDYSRKALLVMATGSGKTRTAIALVDLLMRANWAKRILFLADRVALVNQATNAFKKFLPQASPVNLVTDKEKQGRIYTSTYPTMMKLIDEIKQNGVRSFGSGHFDLVIVDEAHRSIYRKYKAIFDYFDCLLVGLTATPKDDVDRDTYELFGLERGVPTDAYDLKEAVNDGYLVPPKALDVPSKIQRDGLNYDDLSNEEKEAWDTIEWDEDGNIPEAISSTEINTWLFNKPTIDAVLKHLMMYGIKVDNGDKLGKTIIFAKNHVHAQFIQDRFDENYPHRAGKFARVVDFKTDYVQTLIDDFSNKDKDPQIAISVDMLDTGIDVPEIVNLVFFKIVRSRTKFWQMIGRGTRLCPDLFGYKQDKTHFLIFDWCQNFKFFNQNPDFIDSTPSQSLSERLFNSRVDLVKTILQGDHHQTDSDDTYYNELLNHLKYDVQGMNLDNIIVRPKRKIVEKYQNEAIWNTLHINNLNEIQEELSNLPTSVTDDDIDAKKFDLLLFKTELALLKKSKSFMTYQKKILDIVSALEVLQNVPMVAKQMLFILDIQTDSFWQDITIEILEDIRKKLRSLVKLVEIKKRDPIFINFSDEIGQHQEIELDIVTVGMDFEKFNAKAKHFLKVQLNHIAVQKIYKNKPITEKDLTDIEDMLVSSGVVTDADINQLKKRTHLGFFIRSIIGLDREAAKFVFAEFLKDKKLTADQIQFLDMMINHLTEKGIIDPKILYESPYTDMNDMGISGIFEQDDVFQIIHLLKSVSGNTLVN